MSKRFIFPQQYGERKRAKLDISLSDHNFPLSQNADNAAENWGDDNDDEILLLASQACEEAYDKDTSTLSDYSICMQPSSTSTQISNPSMPSTSKTTFTFKKPSSSPVGIVTTQLRDKCQRISSPLPGISSKIISNESHNNLVFNDKIFKGQDPEYVYRQLLQMQEENAKLKLENGKLQEKCVTKEGEASILRTQLKNCQTAVDNVRLEKIKAQEKAQMEWADKLTAANNQMHDLRNQLDFKNLEIISMKEKCKLLESNKIRLTQVTVSANDISLSHRNNNISHNDAKVTHGRKLKTTCSAVQTESRTYFLKLNKPCRLETSKLNQILPYIAEPIDKHYSILDYNERLKKLTESSSNKCGIFSTFHRLPTTPKPSKERRDSKISVASIYEDLTFIAACNELDKVQEKYLNIFKLTQIALDEVHKQLEMISQRMTTAFQKEMIEKYAEATSTYLVLNIQELLSGRMLIKEEQGISARRFVAVQGSLLENTRTAKLEQNLKISDNVAMVDLLCRICRLFDSTSSAILYGGLVLSITMFIERILKYTQVNHESILKIIGHIIRSRSLPTVACYILRLLKMLKLENVAFALCKLKLDNEQERNAREDTCMVQMLLKQIEVALKCIERQNLIDEALETTENLIIFHTYFKIQEKVRCDCELILTQVMVYALRICAVMLNNTQTESYTRSRLLGVCRGGLQVLQGLQGGAGGARDAGAGEGLLADFTHHLRNISHPDTYGNIMSEMLSAFQTSVEECPPSFHNHSWMKSFEGFSLAD